jgi:hypothetical protein
MKTLLELFAEMNASNEAFLKAAKKVGIQMARRTPEYKTAIAAYRAYWSEHDRINYPKAKQTTML